MRVEDRGDYLCIVGDAADRRHFTDIIAKARALPVYGGSLDPQAIRQSGLDLADGPLATACPDDVVREWVDADGVRCCWFRPAGRDGADPILYIHGGGYVGGSIEASRGIAGSIAMAFAAPVLAVGYRQAPEHPYPAAVDDTRTAYAWLAARTTAPILVVGDSAGGALAVTVALEARRRGMPAARGVIASSGWFDLRMRGKSWTTNDGRDLVTPALGRMFVDAYLAGTDADVVDDLVRDGLASAPPMLVQMGGCEGPLSDAAAFVAEAQRLNVDVRFEVYRDMPHNWVKFASTISDAAFYRMAVWASDRT